MEGLLCISVKHIKGLRSMKVKMIVAAWMCCLLVGCGKEITNYSANAVNELKGGKAPYEVFQEDTISEIQEGGSDALLQVVEKYIQSIDVVNTEVTENTAVYTCSVPDVSNVISEIVNSELFEVELNKRAITGDFDGFEDYIYSMACNNMDACNKIVVTVEGYCSQDMLVTSRDLMQPLVQMLSVEIPTKTTDEADAEELIVGTGDFVTKVGKNRVLISNIEVADTADAIKDVTESGVYVTFDATNLGTKKVIVDSAFYGVTDTFEKAETESDVFGLNDCAAVGGGKTAHMSAFVHTEVDGMLVWDSDACGAHFYRWK